MRKEADEEEMTLVRTFFPAVWFTTFLLSTTKHRIPQMATSRARAKRIALLMGLPE
jgi:hypothetical protein